MNPAFKTILSVAFLTAACSGTARSSVSRVCEGCGTRVAA